MIVNEDKIEFELLETAGFSTAIDGMRNPLNSWEKSDSYYVGCWGEPVFVIGEADMKLATALIKAGSEHCKFLRQIYVSFNANLPRYIWSELDTYKFNTKNSCSTMHTLLNKKEKITTDQFVYNEEDEDVVTGVVTRLNSIRREYLVPLTQEEKNKCKRDAKMILPEGFLQKRTVATSYAELRNMYHQRKNHALPEWSKVFVEFVKSLPYSELITM